MKRFLALLLGLVFAAGLNAWADGIDDQYVRIYNVIQEGDVLSTMGQSAQALAKYNEAQASLRRFQKTYPNWNNAVVAFRLNYLDGRVTELAPTVPASIRQNPAVSASQPAPAITVGAPNAFA